MQIIVAAIFANLIFFIFEREREREREREMERESNGEREWGRKKHLVVPVLGQKMWITHTRCINNRG